MKIALAQLNPIVGDLDGNVRLLQAAAERAVQGGADLLVAPELVVSGYPPKDLLLRAGFVSACDRAVEQFAASLPGELGVLLGHPTRRGLSDGQIANAASLLSDRTITATVHKMLLPNYDVFDERRYFRPARNAQPVEFRGRNLGVHICEDAWWGEASTSYHLGPAPRPDPVRLLAEAGADILINLSASPFEIAKPDRRVRLLSRHARSHRLRSVFVNQVGGNDDLVFDGQSFVLDADGELVARLAAFDTDFQIIDIDVLRDATDTPQASRESLILDALILGLRDYMRKCGFADCVLGLSGGIDSALACYIAAQAVGPEHVHGLLMPSRFSSEHSIADAERLARTLGIDHAIIPIDDVHRAYEGLAVLGADLAGQPQGVADQNLQARIRGAIVMTRSNRYGWMPLATGNKSELAVGYCTLYGDMCGGFAVLADVLKRDVYSVSRHVNDVREGRETIPVRIIEKAPSAELAPDQFDQDTLPPYELLDAILEGLIEREESPQQLQEQFPPESVAWVVRALDLNEFKRRQMPPGIKLTQRAFGSGRRMPIAARIAY
jgi:NAD+ synthase (glutamine-hydrolysing)